MLIIKLWNYIRGYVIIKINGEYGERLLNQAALKNLYIWDIERVDCDTLIARISIKDFLKLSCLVRKTRCRICIIERVGLFFIMRKIRKRKVFLAGAILFVAIIYILSSFIWSIEINSMDDKLNAAVRRDLHRWGLREGIFKHGLDKKYYVDKLLSKYSDISWAEIEIKGSRIIVEMVKKEPKPELEENTPCDIIASKDGIIEEIMPLNGEAQVEVGDTVCVGDVLISGYMYYDNADPGQDQNSDKREVKVRAQGIVKARVWYQKAIKVSLVQEEKKLTGRLKKTYKLNVGKHTLNFQWGKTSFDLYDVNTVADTKLFSKFMGGLSFSVVNIEELENKKRFLGVEGATAEAEKQLLSEFESFVDNNKVTQKKMEFTLDADGKSVIGSLTMEVIEDIGQKKEI